MNDWTRVLIQERFSYVTHETLLFGINKCKSIYAAGCTAWNSDITKTVQFQVNILFRVRTGNCFEFQSRLSFTLHVFDLRLPSDYQIKHSQNRKKICIFGLLMSFCCSLCYFLLLEFLSEYDAIFHEFKLKVF